MPGSVDNFWFGRPQLFCKETETLPGGARGLVAAYREEAIVVVLVVFGVGLENLNQMTSSAKERGIPESIDHSSFKSGDVYALRAPPDTDDTRAKPAARDAIQPKTVSRNSDVSLTRWCGGHDEGRGEELFGELPVFRGAPAAYVARREDFAR